MPSDATGPWEEIRRCADSLSLVASRETLSRVYHELKWALPEGTALLVTEVSCVPKLKGLPPGTLTWLRDHVDP